MVTPAQPSRRFLAPGDKLGKYEVIRQIAVGGMAELYLTRTVGLEGFEKLVCVKRILPQFINNPSFVNMFLNEARLAATLHHPNIAQVYDIGQEHGEYFFSMEYVHGEDLGRLVASGRENGVPISLDCALTLASGLCAGLHHAHEKTSPEGKPLGVVHRDVSPTNVLVSYDGAVKLLDFGIARASSDPASQTGLKGKISYMSPEQCRGRTALDRRSDVFSVGTILYELTTGRLPFVDETEYGVLHQIVNRDADPPSRLVPSYPPALEAIVMRALARDPDRRFSTALELQNQLEDYAHDNRLRVSPLVLARLMSTLFPARLEDWDHARAQGAFFVEQHVVRTLIESGKTGDSPHYMPRPLPPPDDTSAAAAIGAPASPEVDSERTELVEPLAAPRPAQRPSPPRMPTPPPIAPTPPPRFASQVPGPPPFAAQTTMMPTPPPRMATPQPGSLHMPPPGVAPGPLPTPPPAMATPPGTMRGPQRLAPVPNMPGAVPIVLPLPAPPVPSGGTLVSGAMQAGRPSPPVSPQPMPMQPPYGAPAAGPNGPAMPGSFGYSSGEYMGAGAAAGYGGAAAGYGHPRPQTAGDARNAEMAPHGVGDVTEQVRRSAARPTLIVRHRKRSPLPLVAAFVAVAGAGVGVWLVVGRDGASSRPDTDRSEPATPPSTEPVAKPAPVTGAPATGPAPANTAAAASADPTAKPTEPAAPEAAEPAANAGREPARANSAAAASADPTAKPADPSTPPADRAGPAVVSSEPDARADPKRKAAKAAQDPRKPPRPKARPETKRVESKRSKPDAKEQSQWDNDSPFLPQSTTKR